MIAIAGGKGGCGKTTTTVALARALAERIGGPAYAADADWDMPDLHALAGVDTAPSVAAVRTGDPPRRVAQPVGSSPVRVLPAPTADDPRSGGDAAAAFRSLSTVSAPVLLDCPAGAGRDAAVPLRAADVAVLVSTTAPASLRDAAKTAAMAASVDTPVVAAALTRSTTVPDGAPRLLETDAVVPVPPVEDPLADDRAGRAYDALADYVSERVESPTSTARKLGGEHASPPRSGRRAAGARRGTKR